MKVLEQVKELYISLTKTEKDLFSLPEVGFKESQTIAYLKSFLKDENIPIVNNFGINGFQASIGSGKPHIGLISELDALYVPGHFQQGPNGEAHACGHHMQSTIMLHVMKILNERSFHGTVSLFAIAAEEYIDMDFRRSLQKKGVIDLRSGKQNLLLKDAFNDVDVVVSVHTMGETSNASMEVNATLSGFVYKTIRFEGQGAHAAVAPSEGVNALNALALTQNAIAFLRETFREEERVRIHMITTNGGQSVNSVPEEAVLEGYIRAADPNVLHQISQKVSNAAIHSAAALGAHASILDEMGYAPLIQCRPLSDIFVPYIKEVVPVVVDNQLSFAAGDIGDVGLFVPTIQLGYSGCVGRVHGNDFRMKDATQALVNPTYVVSAGVIDLLEHPEKVRAITSSFNPSITIQEYRKLHGQ